MMQNGAFDFERPDAISGALDDIVGAALEPEISSLVTAREIARGYPPMAEKLARSLRILPIAQRVIALFARALRQIPRFPGRQLKPIVIDDGHLKARHRQAHGAGLYFDVERVEIAERQPVLARSEMILRREAECLLEVADDFGIERLAATADAAQAEIVSRELIDPERHHAAQQRRHRCEIGHP